MVQRSYVRRWSYLGQHQLRRSGKSDRPRRRAVASKQIWPFMVHDLLAPWRRRFVANPCRGGRSDGFGIEVAAAIGRSLFDLDRNPVGVGEAILANAGHLPGDFHIRFVRLDAELVVRNLASHDGLRELADYGQLIPEIAVERLEPIRQRDRSQTSAIGGDGPVINVLHVGRFDEGMVEILVGGVERVVNHERAATFGERADYGYSGARSPQGVDVVDAEVQFLTGVGVNVGAAGGVPDQRVVGTARHACLSELEAHVARSLTASRVSNDRGCKVRQETWHFCKENLTSGACCVVIYTESGVG